MLEELKTRVLDCSRCPELCKSRSQVVFDRFNINSTKKLLIIGEAPGETEDKKGEPFLGVSGTLLNTYLSKFSLDNDAYITNAVKCRPEKNRPPTFFEIKECNIWLLEQIRLLSPKVIMVLGKSAFRSLLLSSPDIEIPKENLFKDKDKIISIPFNGQDIPVVCVYHPSYYLRQKNALKMSDFEVFEAAYSSKFIHTKQLLGN